MEDVIPKVLPHFHINQDIVLPVCFPILTIEKLRRLFIIWISEELLGQIMYKGCMGKIGRHKELVSAPWR